MAAASAHVAMRGWGAGWVVAHQVVAQVAVAGGRRRRSVLGAARLAVGGGARSAVRGVGVCWGGGGRVWARGGGGAAGPRPGARAGGWAWVTPVDDGQ